MIPVRAGLAESLEGSEFTSIQQRLREVARQVHGKSQQRVGNPGGRTTPGDVVTHVPQRPGEVTRVTTSPRIAA
jgi:hypothetical protein